MAEIISLINDAGVSILIVALFVWDWITNKRSVNAALEQNSKALLELQISNNNIAKSLELLSQSMDTQEMHLFEHDKRTEIIEQLLSSMRNGDK